jgi:futalosine hydrolase
MPPIAGTMKLLVVAAVEQELARILSELHAVPVTAVNPFACRRAVYREHEIFLGVVGIGVVSAGVGASALIATLGPDAVVMIGSAGALPGSGLESGDLVVASSEVFSELGLADTAGIGNGPALGLPGLDQKLPLDATMTGLLARAAQDVGTVVKGPLLTVAGVSASIDVACARRQTFEAVAENMEGYAVALAAARFHLPAAEVRGISNQAGDRDKTRWDLPRANRTAQDALLAFLRRI